MTREDGPLGKVGDGVSGGDADTAGLRRAARLLESGGGLIAQQAAEENQCRDRHDAVGGPEGGERVEAGHAGEVDAAEQERVVDEDDGEEAGDEGAQVVAAAEPDADGAADEDEAEAAEAEGGTHLQF